MQQNNDIAIIKGCQKKQPASQRALFDKYSKKLFTTCLRYVGNHADAQDVLQESFIRIFKYFNSFDPEKGSLKNWLLRICINESLRRLDTKKTFEELEKLEEEPSADPLIMSQLQMEDLLAIIGQISLPYRTVLNLFLIEGFSHGEIAEMLKIKKSSSRSILTRAKVLFIKKLEDSKKQESWI